MKHVHSFNKHLLNDKSVPVLFCRARWPSGNPPILTLTDAGHTGLPKQPCTVM